MQHRIVVWDLPTRLGHWLLALAVTAAVLTGWQGGEWLVWHQRLGLFLCGWLTFRVIWGFIGATTAQFRHFLPTRASISAYLRGDWHGVGHNPLGALSVLALLTLLAVQLTTGLVSTDDIAFTGPLYPLVSAAVSDTLTRLHRAASWGLLALIVLHLCAIWFYSRIRRQPLIRAMFTGDALHHSPAPALHPANRWAIVIALLGALGVSWLASGAWLIPAPAAVNTLTAPAW